MIFGRSQIAVRKMIVSTHHNCAWLASRCRKRLTVTTRTRCWRASLMRSRSPLRSSSLVTRYVAFPRIAASRMASSSGSRQALSSPEISTSIARAAISLTNLSASRRGYLNLRRSRGRLSTSASSVSWEMDVTTLNWSRVHALTTWPGGPEGFRKAETQTFVSSRATNGTAVSLYFSPSFGDLRVNVALTDILCPAFHPAQQLFEFIAPLLLRIHAKRNARLLFQAQRLKRSEDTVFINRANSLLWGTLWFRQCHENDYNGDRRNESTAMAASLVE